MDGLVYHEIETDKKCQSIYSLQVYRMRHALSYILCIKESDKYDRQTCTYTAAPWRLRPEQQKHRNS